MLPWDLKLVVASKLFAIPPTPPSLSLLAFFLLCMFARHFCDLQSTFYCEGGLCCYFLRIGTEKSILYPSTLFKTSVTF